ncbi:hypothetical protein CDAR_464921 [Caerostris darwini]|uniref:Uncharacterized protein n=1 Tax=Caerostris darwini TaxID=1538125 RepID=A0AAV4UJP7_9ARAC|nr:hypothetical protein CDAR_464921 [Caerostris darwini]
MSFSRFSSYLFAYRNLSHLHPLHIMPAQLAVIELPVLPAETSMNNELTRGFLVDGLAIKRTDRLLYNWQLTWRYIASSTLPMLGDEVAIKLMCLRVTLHSSRLPSDT